MKFSPQQEAFLDWTTTGTGSCVLEAVAGAGKTTTLIEAASRMRGQGAILAYNKKIADEIKGKLTGRGLDWKKAQAGTVHSFGFSAYRKNVPDVRVDDEKVGKIFDAALPEAHPMARFRSQILQMVSLAKQSAFGIVRSASDRSAWEHLVDHFGISGDEDEFFPVDEAITAAMAILARSTELLRVADFDDMIYMPLVHRMRVWQFDWVMVDEAQDTNAARRALVRVLVKKGGRVIAVGDRHQAIYGFTGADADALDLIAQDFRAIRLPLTTTYRCPKAVVAMAQQWVSHIQAAATAPEGSVSSMVLEDLVRLPGLSAEDAVLCRNTKPLVALALSLIRGGVACRVEGRDIAAGLVKLARRWKVRTLEKLEERLEEYVERERTKLLAKKQESRMAVLEDTVATLTVLIQACRADQQHSVNDLVARIESLFADGQAEVLTLSTIHKAKGREWRRVFWLDRAGTLPSKWARQEWQQEQERNLCYVAATRAQEKLIEVLVPKKPAH